MRDAGTPTGVAMILVDGGGENQIVVVPGSNYRLMPSDVRRYADMMADAAFSSFKWNCCWKLSKRP